MKKALLLALTIVIAILPLSACKNNGEEYSMLSYYEEVEGDVQTGEDKTETGEVTSGATGNTSTTSNKNNTSTGKGEDNKKPDTPVVNNNVNELKGKTFTYAQNVGTVQMTTAQKSSITAFEKKYGCKLELHEVPFSGQVQALALRQSTGDPYDIFRIHGSMFPESAISGVSADLTQALSVLNPVNNAKSATEMFNWKGGSYGYCTEKSLTPYLFYYNKLLFADAGLEDPQTLYKNGQWTWDKLLEMGRYVADNDTSGTAFFGDQFLCTNFMGGTSIYINSDGVPVNGLRDPLVYKAFEYWQKIYTGTKPIGKLDWGGEYYETYFPKGGCYILAEESTKYATLAPKVLKSMAFGKDVDNLGIVPFPENETGKYPTGWYNCYAAGAGADPRPALLLAEFEATYKSPVVGKNDWSGENKKIIDNLYKKDFLPNRHGSYSTSKTNTTNLYNTIMSQVKKGGDITKIINDFVPQYDACLEATVGKGNFITK